MKGNETSYGNSSSLKDFIINTRYWIRYFLSKWIIIVAVAIIGALLGLAYAFTQKAKYAATTTFVLESSGGKGNGLGAYANIASSLGIDLGVPGQGLFDDENIIELYRSRSMISQTLLSKAEFNGKSQLLIERYLQMLNFDETEQGGEKLQKIAFNQENKYPTNELQILHDSIISQAVKNINANILKVGKKDKKLNLIFVSIISQDELFSKKFNEALVEKVNEFYLETKTQRNLQNVAILQAKTDSVRSLMSGSINRAAAIADATPNQNPTRMAQRVAPMQNAKMNAEINQGVLSSLLQNLELGKIALLKETPLIQIVDDPVLPLDKQGFGKKKGVLLGCLIGIFIVGCYLAIKKILQASLSE